MWKRVQLPAASHKKKVYEATKSFMPSRKRVVWMITEKLTNKKIVKHFFFVLRNM